MTGTEDELRERRQDATAVVLKIVGVAVAVGLVIGLGAWVMVKALGLDAGETTSPGIAQVEPRTPLPSSALPVPTGTDLPTPENTGTPGTSVSGELYLSASPVLVKPSERINLTGRWLGHDNQTLVVQRFDGGQWADFAGVQARVNVGTFSTYVLTSRTGDQKFRVFDPETETASNEVTVTVG